MRIGIDLLWVRAGKCGGTEAYIRNLLDGFACYFPEEEFVLFAARDNCKTFFKYTEHSNMRLFQCPLDSAMPWKRIAWENLYLAKQAQKAKIEAMFIPVYSKPWTFGSRIPYVTVIHDLQAFHYPQFFSMPRRVFLKNKWKYACRTSAQLITISDFCKRDLIRHYPFASDKIHVIYDPVTSSGQTASFETVGKKYGIDAGKYFYCVSSMLPHKNLGTLLQVMAELKRMGETPRLVLSGVGGRQAEFSADLKRLEITDAVVQTGFVTDEERDCLYENCEMFLYPSMFEGFGMPPVEAMRKGRPVVMTKEACLEEITGKKAVYVRHPQDVQEWIDKIRFAREQTVQPEAFLQYELRTITEQVMQVLRHAVRFT